MEHAVTPENARGHVRPREGEESPGRGAPRKMLFGLINDVRAEVQNLQVSLREIVDGGEIEDREARDRETREAVLRGCRVFAAASRRIDHLFDELYRLRPLNPEFYDRCGDEVTNIRNYWERARSYWPGSRNDSPVHDAKKAGRWTDEVVLHCGLLTIPNRVNRELGQMYFGQRLNFHDLFEDELPNPEHRHELLRHMVAHPLLINGVIDAESGCIYSIDPNRRRRRRSVYLPLAVVVGVAVLFSLPVLLPGLGGTVRSLLESVGVPGGYSEPYKLLGAYVLIFAGGLAHLAVSIQKDVNARESSSILIVDDFWTWAHVRKGDLYKKIAYLWIGLAGLVVLSATTPGAGWTAAFFVGYSIDSFVDVFMHRFNQTIVTRVDEIKSGVRGAAGEKRNGAVPA